MRTKALLVAAALAAGAVTSMAQSNVYSLNVVGYVNKTVAASGLTLLANPLNTTNNSILGLFGGAGGVLPEGTQIYLWQGTTYAIGARDDLGAAGWSPDGFETSMLNPGTGFFMRNNTATPISLTFVGEVLQGNLTNHINSGLALLGSKVPQAGQPDTVLGLPVTDGDQVYQWVGTTYSIYTADSLNDPAPWGTPAPNIGVAEGFFSRKAVAVDWVRNFTVQ